MASVNTKCEGKSEEPEYLMPVISNSEEEIGEYYFESDSLALKSNRDYQLLLKTLVKLESQRAQVVQNLEKLYETKEKAINDPLGFVNALQNGEELNLPLPIKIAPVPEIDWEKYNVNSILNGMRPTTRKKQQKTETTLPVVDSAKEKAVESGLSFSSRNQPWSVEEQRKLEELLMKYPDEKVASRRWEKIAKEMGTRTVLQVQSRIQKYFVALKKQGLPVPGKPPSTALVRPSYKFKYRRRGGVHGGTGRSSFMKAFDLSESSQTSPQKSVPEPSVSHSEVLEVSDEEDIAESVRHTELYQDLMKYKKLKKIKFEELDTGKVVHYGFECDGCGVSPIEGTRWHCQVCPEKASTDLCQRCTKRKVESNGHDSSHAMTPYNSVHIKDTFTIL